jgi:hypothetical protein
MVSTVGTRRAKVNLSFIGLLCVALLLGACGGDLNPRYYGGREGQADGGMCFGYGRYSCGCVDEPLVLGVSLAFVSSSGSGLSDLDIDFFRQADVPATPSSIAPAKGTAGADGYFVASLRNETGDALTTLVFKDPRFALADAGYTWRPKAEFILALPPGTSLLHIENWDTGQVLVDLDLRGHLQLLCIDRPCLSICQIPGMDAAAPPAVDAGAVDGGTVEANQL